MAGSTPTGWPTLSLFVVPLVTMWLLPLLPLVVLAVAMSISFRVAPRLSLVVLVSSFALPLAIELVLVASFATTFRVALVLGLVPPALLFGPWLAFSFPFAATLLVCPRKGEASVGLRGAFGRDLGVHGLLQELVVVHDLLCDVLEGRLFAQGATRCARKCSPSEACMSWSILLGRLRTSLCHHAK